MIFVELAKSDFARQRSDRTFRGDADDQVILSGQPVQPQIVGGKQRHKHRTSQARAGLPQSERQLLIQFERKSSTAISFDRRSRVIRRQVECPRQTRQMFEPKFFVLHQRRALRLCGQPLNVAAQLHCRANMELFPLSLHRKARTIPGRKQRRTARFRTDGGTSAAKRVLGGQSDDARADGGFAPKIKCEVFHFR